MFPHNLLQRFLRFALCVPCLLFATPSFGADAQLTVSASLTPSTLGAGQQGVVELHLGIPAGWHLMSLDPGPGPQPLRVRWRSGAGLQFVGPWHGPAPEEKMDRGFARLVPSYEQPELVLQRLVQATGPLVADTSAQLEVRGQICTDRQCIPQRHVVEVAYRGSAEPVQAPAPTIELPELTMAPEGAPGGPEMGASASAGTSRLGVAGEGTASELNRAKEQGVLVFMAMAFVFGLGALATPCVFPAIPLTVSFFSKFSGESFGRGARLAFVYASSMVAAFTFLGVMLSVIFGVTGVQQFAAHPVFNLVLGLVLVYFSLNLLGLFELAAPEFLLSAVNRLESKYGAAPGGSSGTGTGYRDYVVVAIAAASATTVFFTCTVAFVGLVLVAAANGEWFWPTLGMLAFASAFALPFFLLALFPQAAKRLQGKAGSWLSATRVTLGFLELAAATKFFSNSDLVWGLGLLSRHFVLALWVPLFALCGLFLLGKLQIGEETTRREDGGTGVVQMLAAVGMFSVSLSLATGLFNNQTFGGWVDGWLPPATNSASRAAGQQDSQEQPLRWLYSLDEARARAARDNQLVFVNYTGYTCTNCRYMEGGVFPDARVAPLLRKMVLVELYTDNGSAENDANRDDQIRRFQTAALPLYSVETPQGAVLGSFPSSTNDVGEFAGFLQAALDKGQKAVASAVESGDSVGQPDQAAEASAGALRLKTTALFGGQFRAAVVPGKWTLLNFWATWCSPCREELEAFLVREGLQFASQGGAFHLIAVEDEENLSTARDYIKTLALPETAALRVSAEAEADEVDPRFGFDGTLPFTALVSPEGKLVWSHTDALTLDQLREGLSKAKL